MSFKIIIRMYQYVELLAIESNGKNFDSSYTIRAVKKKQKVDKSRMQIYNDERIFPKSKIIYSIV